MNVYIGDAVYAELKPTEVILYTDRMHTRHWMSLEYGAVDILNNLIGEYHATRELHDTDDADRACS